MLFTLVVPVGCWCSAQPGSAGDVVLCPDSRRMWSALKSFPQTECPFLLLRLSHITNHAFVAVSLLGRRAAFYHHRCDPPWHASRQSWGPGCPLEDFGPRAFHKPSWLPLLNMTTADRHLWQQPSCRNWSNRIHATTGKSQSSRPPVWLIIRYVVVSVSVVQLPRHFWLQRPYFVSSGADQSHHHLRPQLQLQRHPLAWLG